MTEEVEFSGFSSQLTTVTGFLGAITFATMILLMQFPEKIQFSEILISYTAAISFFFIITTLGGSIDASHAKNISERFFKLIKYCYMISFYGLMALIPALIFSFSIVGAIILAILIGIVLILFDKLGPKNIEIPTVNTQLNLIRGPKGL